MPKDDSIGGLWLKTGRDGKRYFAGEVDGTRVVVFKNDFKKDGEKTPDYRVYRAREGAARRDSDDDAPF